MFKLRDNFMFDEFEPSPDGIVTWNLFAVSDDKRTFYVSAGANGGERLLVHFSAGVAYMARQLHADTLVKVEKVDSVYRFLRRAADRCIVTRLAQVEETCQTFYGSHPDGPRHHRFLEIPGFRREYAPGVYQDGFSAVPIGTEQLTHVDGWYTRTRLALPLSAPSFAPEAQAWDIREGVYLSFPDGSYRLIPRKEYYAFLLAITLQAQRNSADPAPVTRQGDLLFFSGQWEPQPFHLVTQDNDEQNWESWPDQDRKAIDRDTWPGETEPMPHSRRVPLDRHEFDVDSNIVRHPEHGEMELPGGPWTAVLMPGTSRPYSRGRGGVD